MIYTRDFKMYAPPKIDREAVLKYAGCKEPDEPTLKLLEECIDEVATYFVYRVAFFESTLEISDGIIDLGFAKTESALLKKTFAGCDRYIVFAATVGLGIDRHVTRYSKTEPSRSLMFQALGTERIESLCKSFTKDIRKELNIKTTRRVSPGYGDISLDLQPKILRALDATRLMGLTLNDSLLMLPTKSVTAFMGIKNEI